MLILSSLKIKRLISLGKQKVDGIDVATDKFLNEDKKIVVEMIREEMLEAAENLEFEKAAKLRDEMNKLEKEIKL